MKKAVVLLSGGLDSTTCLAHAKSKGFECHALSFQYGQKHNSELQAAKQIATAFHVPHKIVQLDINQFGGSALTDHSLAVPDYNEKEAGIPITYVPARNTVFLSIALGFAEVLGAKDIFIGVSAVDYSGYPDCRPEYIQAFQTLANLATKSGVEQGSITIHAPFVYLSKAETIRLGIQLGVDYTMTISCYQATEQGRACGKCDSCMFRKKGFMESGITDPTVYL